jgi:GTPase SAR1 family protein
LVDALAGVSNRFAVLIGNSGVGKSSLLGRCARGPETPDVARTCECAGQVPHVFAESRRWRFLALRPGVEPVQSLVETFLKTWRLDRTSLAWPTRRAEWVDALPERKLTLRDLIDQTRRR